MVYYIKSIFQRVAVDKPNVSFRKGCAISSYQGIKFSWIEIQDGFYFMLEPPGKAITLWLALDKVI